MAKDTNPPYKHNARFKKSLSSKSIKSQPVTWYGWATRVGWDRARMIIPYYSIWQGRVHTRDQHKRWQKEKKWKYKS